MLIIDLINSRKLFECYQSGLYLCTANVHSYIISNFEFNKFQYRYTNVHPA